MALNGRAVLAGRRERQDVLDAVAVAEARATLELRRLRAALARERAVTEAVRLRYEALGGCVDGGLWERAVREVRAVAGLDP